ncbi:hypothetical protein Ddc_10866 [Ditylenchus destructor]|nr:hypothetical protein Ddc_10866 [Ditylenchus destructor]
MPNVELTRALAPRLLQLLPQWGNGSQAQWPPYSDSSQSTPGEVIHSPTVLLSPVLSRPFRSQSASSTPFLLRSMSGGAVNFDSFSESELSGPGAGTPHPLARSRAHSRVSPRPSDSSSPLATPPPIPPCRSPGAFSPKIGTGHPLAMGSGSG